MSWEDVAKLLLVVWGFGGLIIAFAMAIKWIEWIEKRWLK